jgi:hypothetical protein
MYKMRSKILHGSDLMQLDQGRAFGWDPPWWEEREMNTDLWGLMQTGARNWLLAAPLKTPSAADTQPSESPDHEFVPVFNRYGGIDLYDIYTHETGERTWIGSRRTLEQCKDSLRAHRARQRN